MVDIKLNKTTEEALQASFINTTPSMHDLLEAGYVISLKKNKVDYKFKIGQKNMLLFWINDERHINPFTNENILLLMHNHNL